jgi:hypothetical protein
MRWAVGWAAVVAFAMACSSPLAPQRPLGGTDAAVDQARPLGPTAVDAWPDLVGRVPPAPNGTPCQSGSDCGSGFCADGVCCNIACTGRCVTCAMPGAVGTCYPVDNGAVAHPGDCPAANPATCGMTGMCDGVGGCQLYPPGTFCARSTCVDGATLRGASTCDGLGTCTPGPAQSCAPYTCANGACQVNDCQLDPSLCPPPGNRDASSD